MSEKRTPQFHKTFNTSEIAEYWRQSFEHEPPWLQHHPMRSHIIDFPHLVSAFRIFGDDTGISKNCTRPVSCLTWDADISVGDVWLNKIPVYIIPVFLQLPESGTLDSLDTVAAWSFNALSQGRWPYYDHQGEPFKPTSFRGKRAGKPLTRDKRSGALVLSVSDWDWSEKTYKFGTAWASDEICWICTATKHDPTLDTDYCRFCRLPEKAHGAYMRSIGHRIPVCSILGWHKSLVMPEAMHCGPLGVFHLINGNLLKKLSDTDTWGDGGDFGLWYKKLNCKLLQP